MIGAAEEWRLKQILAEMFELDPSTIDGTTSVDNVERWDSLQHISMILSIEQEFGVRFTEEEMTELLNYERLRFALASKLSLEASSPWGTADGERGESGTARS
jgi:acyl carrier protein